MMETWDIWYPNAGATGLPVCRARIESAASVWLHAAPNVLEVSVFDEKGALVARGADLKRSGETVPMTLLSKRGDAIVREDRFPTTADTGTVVLLTGGEAGKLIDWWNAPDGSAWRWRVEFFNRR